MAVERAWHHVLNLHTKLAGMLDRNAFSWSELFLFPFLFLFLFLRPRFPGLLCVFFFFLFFILFSRPQRVFLFSCCLCLFFFFWLVARCCVLDVVF